MYGVCASIFSYAVGKLAKHIGLQTTMVMMLLVGLAHCIFMISWTPDYSQGIYVIFLMAATFGFTNSLATAQVRAIFGVFFPHDPSAYSAAILFETFGLITGSVLSIFFQTRIKVYVYMGVIFAGIVSYVFLEVRHRRRLLAKEKGSVSSSSSVNDDGRELDKSKFKPSMDNPLYNDLSDNKSSNLEF